MKCHLFLAVIMGGSARRTGSAPLLFGLIQMARLKAAAAARASLTAPGKCPPPILNPSPNNIIPSELVCHVVKRTNRKMMVCFLNGSVKKKSEAGEVRHSPAKLRSTKSCKTGVEYSACSHSESDRIKNTQKRQVCTLSPCAADGHYCSTNNSREEIVESLRCGINSNKL